MVFSSSIFLLYFLPITFIISYFIKTKYINQFLLIASLIFYAWGEPLFVFLMLFSIIINWFCGNKIKGNYKKLWTTIAIVCNLGLLGYYKYANFFVDLLNQITGTQILAPPNIILPIGISFFTFQAISYIIDVYRGEVEPSKKITNVALYISFFPQLIAGPIVKYKDIDEQIKNRTITWQNISEGFKRFIYGLSKKVLIANILGLCVDTIFNHNITTIGPLAAWIGAIAYTFQIYYDFSGYSDMAIGLGKMFGFSYLENFNYPYLSTSITEFWRRWHISLGTWFKEYLYIPLGGNRKGKIRTYINLFIVFLLTGLWHGADISFVIWGLYHGFFSIIERLGLKKILQKYNIIGIVYCFLIVMFGWILFRAANLNIGFQYIAAMFTPSTNVLPVYEYLNNKTILILILACVGAGPLQLLPTKIKNYWRGSIIEAIFCIIILILSIAAIANNTYNPFIYFQF